MANITKAIVRRQMENDTLTNAQVILFFDNGDTKINLDISPRSANGVEKAAHLRGMAVANEVNEVENGKIFIATWII